MNITPIQALQIILDHAHETNLPKRQHDELDTLARFVAGKLPQEEQKKPEAPPAPSPAVEKTVAQFTPKGGQKPARTRRGRIEAAG